MIRIEIVRHSPFYRAKKDRKACWVACEIDQKAATRHVAKLRKAFAEGGSTIEAAYYDAAEREAAIKRGEF